MKLTLNRKYIPFIILVSISVLLISSCSNKLNPSDSNYMPGTARRRITDSANVRARNIRPPGIKAYAFESGKDEIKEKTLADSILETAFMYIGVPHCMGGTTLKCIDCSGLVMRVFEEYDIVLPHNAQAQSKFGTIINRKEDLIKGDLVFFKESYNTNNYITHSGIYTGDNNFIHTSSGKGVTITSLDDRWWKNKFVFGTRILNQATNIAF